MKTIWNWLSVDTNRHVLSFLGTGVAVIVAAGWTYFTYLESQENKEVSDQFASVDTTTQPASQNAPSFFAGVYIGTSTEGDQSAPIQITIEQHGENIKGTYLLSGMMGKMSGKISGNTYRYQWSLGAFSGQGVSYIKGRAIQGTWGYGQSDNNAGTLTAQLQ